MSAVNGMFYIKRKYIKHNVGIILLISISVFWVFEIVDS